MTSHYHPPLQHPRRANLISQMFGGAGTCDIAITPDPAAAMLKGRGTQWNIRAGKRTEKKLPVRLSGAKKKEEGI